MKVAADYSWTAGAFWGHSSDHVGKQPQSKAAQPDGRDFLFKGKNTQMAL